MTLYTLEKGTKNGGENMPVMLHSFDLLVPFPSLWCKFTISIHADVGGYAQIKRQSLQPTVFLKTTLTWTTNFLKHVTILPGSKPFTLIQQSITNQRPCMEFVDASPTRRVYIVGECA